MTILSTLLFRSSSSASFSTPFLATLLPCIGLAYTLQAFVAVPSILAQSEKYYDLSGSVTYLSCTALSLYLPVMRARFAAAAGAAGVGKVVRGGSAGGGGAGVVRALMAGGGVGGGLRNWRQVVLSAAVGVWATRLGIHTFTRISRDGSDPRFDPIRRSPASFAGAFFAQATWVSICLLPVLALNSLPAATIAAATATSPLLLRTTDIIGLLLYTSGLAFEVIADRQKNRWVAEKKAKRHSEDFLTRGLWGRSRHPNYFGEVVLWMGIATVAGGVLVRGGGLAGMGLGLRGGSWGAKAVGVGMAVGSPGFVTGLLLKVSGVPLTDSKYDKRYGHRKDYQEWKRNTPTLIPKW